MLSRFGALSLPIGCFSVYYFIMDLYGTSILSGLLFVLLLTPTHYHRLTILTIMILYFVIGLEIFKLKGKFKVISHDRIPLGSTYNASFDQPDNNINITNIKSDPLHITELHDSEPFSINRTTSHNPTTSHKRHPSSKITLNSKQSPISFRHYLVMPLIFFIILLATWVPLTINRVYAFIHPDQEPYPLLVAVGAMGSLRGFWNGILFVTMGVKGWKRQKRMERQLLDSARSSVY